MDEAVSQYYVYILECGDGSLYTGWTNHLEHRVALHAAGKGAKYTRSRLPVKLVYQEVFESATEARKREAQLKQCTRQQKLALISNQ
ncbi:MAG: GIY-YIG nuclease family protein [Christensenellales bacterium]|jgi:putative endonuclease|nr:GIY-YIG nuclease family protein [Clostridiales bacterium]